MKIGIDVTERMTILSLLPKEGNFATLRIVREMGNKVGVSADEYKEFGVEDVLEDGKKIGVKWNLEGNKPKDIEFKSKEISIIAEKLKELETNAEYNKTLKEGKTPKPALEQRHFTLYEKFVEEKEPETKENAEKK